MLHTSAIDVWVCEVQRFKKARLELQQDMEDLVKRIEAIDEKEQHLLDLPLPD